MKQSFVKMVPNERLLILYINVLSNCLARGRERNIRRIKWAQEKEKTSTTPFFRRLLMLLLLLSSVLVHYELEPGRTMVCVCIF